MNNFNIDRGSIITGLILGFLISLVSFYFYSKANNNTKNLELAFSNLTNEINDKYANTCQLGTLTRDEAIILVNNHKAINSNIAAYNISRDLVCHLYSRLSENQSISGFRIYYGKDKAEKPVTSYAIVQEIDNSLSIITADHYTAFSARIPETRGCSGFADPCPSCCDRYIQDESGREPNF
ncbi:MAG TPA: hypothetical protein PK147_00665 [Saprospiraceae bacterium]|nr:hypothetical protein [Saprospiraceae bacterium]MCB9327604.1 hypothetical protein [Lewinellaceae bacterium]HPQ20326.1 hypothetical protein [Saprospiraceae bacterium]HRX27788.1 hypothetical protein [Saprospiraceae bacterium]